jgi:hypothetical protein
MIPPSNRGPEKGAKGQTKLLWEFSYEHRRIIKNSMCTNNSAVLVIFFAVSAINVS